MTIDKRLSPIKDKKSLEVENSEADSLETESSETDAQEDSSADNVDQYLQGLENSNNENLKTVQIEKETFSKAELSHLINTEKLQSLLNSSDDFLSHLGGEIEGFDE